MAKRGAGWVEVGDGGPLVRSRWIYNCYLVPDGGDGSPLVIDVGLPSHGRAATQWLRGAGHDVLATDVTVIATHLHSDHVGGLREFERHHRGGGEVSVVLPERAERYCHGEVPRSPGPREVARIAPVMRSQPFSFGALFEPAFAPHAGYGLRPFVMPTDHPVWMAPDQLIAHASEWVSITAPGHTDDSTVYYNESTRTLASGDAVLTARGQAWFNPEYVDAEQSSATEDRLRGLRVDVLLPGHGRPLVGRDLLATAVGGAGRPSR